MIHPEDESFHPHHDEPYWNESAWIPFLIPERKLSGWVYFFHRTKLGMSVGGVAAWDPSGREMWNCRHHDWGTPYPTPPGADMYDFSLPNGLSVACDEPLKVYRFNYDGDGCTLDFRWEAALPAHDSGYPKQSHEWGIGHFEQCGRLTGTIELDGERLDVDCWSNRDRSWGPRRFDVNPRGDFPWAIASETSAFHVCAMTDVPREQDPVEGTTEPIVFGWYVRDGEMASITGGTRRVERRADGSPTHIVVDGVDDRGRELHAEGECLNWFRWNGIPVFVGFSMVRWDFDGQQCYGELQDFFPYEQFRQFARRRG